jgi:ABC-type multidrug transport system fused ATPase/permease subunit
MSSKPSILAMLRRLWRHVSPRRRLQFAVLFGLIKVASVMEIFSIGAVLPFLGVMIAPEHVYSHPQVQWIVEILGIHAAQELLFPMAAAFMVLVLLSTATRLLVIWATARLTFATGADFSIAIYQRTLYQPYAVHIARNSSEVITGITAKSYRLIHNALLPALTILSSTIMIIMVMSALLAIRPLVSVIAFGGFAGIYVGVIFLVKRRLSRDSELIARETSQIMKTLQEGLGGIRDVIIDSSQDQYCQTYRNADLPLRRADAESTFISLSPRLVVEAMGMVLIVVLAMWLNRQPGGLSTAIPILGALAIGAQRLLPVLQQAYGAWVSIQGNVASVNDAIDLLDQPLPDWALEPVPPPLPYQQRIELRQVSYRYGDGMPEVLQGIGLVIRKGEKIGFIGSTGSGKSTLLDLLMGLLTPTQGQLLIDGEAIGVQNVRAWQACIAHVPQAIFLTDASVEENIAFGVPKSSIDPGRVREAARRAQIADVIEALPEGYASPVGERGVRLSGGQRQRIGIARALYKRASVIVLDEATSALDSATEEAVMSAIAELGPEVTVLMIAHRLTTLSTCDRIIELSEGVIRRQGSYRDIVEGN